MNATAILHNIGLLATPIGSCAKGGQEQGRIALIENAYLAMDGPTILAVGGGDIPEGIAGPQTERIDAGGALLTPGLVDCHTHLVFGGWRQHELALKLQGVPYLDILKNGGGILSTVRATRASTLDALVQKTLPILQAMFRGGVTCCEAKSGYGLSLSQERKQLLAVRRLKECQPVELVSTFLGAHAFPEEFEGDHEGYLRLLIEEMLPAFAQEGLIEFCDVFCDEGVFSAEQSRRILRAASALGLGLKLHTDELRSIGGAQLAKEAGAISAEHLICLNEEGIDALAHSHAVAVLLPSTSFYLDKPFAPAQRLCAENVPVAVATDFNPGSSPNHSLLLSMQFACYKYKMTPEAVLTASTLNAAAALNRAGRLGTLEVGKEANAVLWDAPDLDYLFYRLGNNPAKAVLRRGVFYGF